MSKSYVYVAEIWNPELEYPIEGIFSTPEKAMQYVMQHDKGWLYLEDAYIWKCEIDGYLNEGNEDHITEVAHVVFENTAFALERRKEVNT